MITGKFLSVGFGRGQTGGQLAGGMWLAEDDGETLSSSVLVENRRYLVKVLDSRREYVKMQKLRYDVFHREFRKKKFPFGLDLDRYESRAKHLLVVDKEAQKIVGSYRAICSHDPDHLYTSSEFDISAFSTRPGNKLELSRACIHKDYRNGIVLSLLWRGIGEYVQRTDAGYVFGIPSFKSVDSVAAARIYRHFESLGHVATETMVRPRESHRLEGFTEALAALRAEKSETVLGGEISQAVPPLFHAYAKAGAKIVGEPAIDREFQCIDFFMALKLDEISPLYRRKYVSG